MPDRRLPADTFARIFDKIGTAITVLTLLVTILFGFAWNSNVARQWFESKNIKHIDLLGDACTSAVLLILLVLTTHRNVMVKLERRINLLVPHYEDVIVSGLDKLYPHIKQSIIGINERHSIIQVGPFDQRKLEILGLTLRTVGSTMSPWITDGILDGWHICVHCLDPEFMKKCPEHFPDKWPIHAELQISELRAAAQILKDRHIKLELRTYSVLPVVHGFRFGTRELFYSIIEWTSIGLLKDPYLFYERVRADDLSPRADVYRTLFNNWICEATRLGSPVGLTLPTPVPPVTPPPPVI